MGRESAETWLTTLPLPTREGARRMLCSTTLPAPSVPERSWSASKKVCLFGVKEEQACVDEHAPVSVSRALFSHRLDGNLLQRLGDLMFPISDKHPVPAAQFCVDAHRQRRHARRRGLDVAM